MGKQRKQRQQRQHKFFLSSLCSLCPLCSYSLFTNHLGLLYLDELTDEVAECSLELGVLLLIGVKEEAASQRARQLIERARQELTDAARERKILELVETVFIYKFPNLSRQEIEQMLGLSELKQTRVYQEALEEGLQQGRQEGRQEGELADSPQRW